MQNWMPQTRMNGLALTAALPAGAAPTPLGSVRLATSTATTPSDSRRINPSLPDQATVPMGEAPPHRELRPGPTAEMVRERRANRVVGRMEIQNLARVPGARETW